MLDWSITDEQMALLPPDQQEFWRDYQKKYALHLQEIEEMAEARKFSEALVMVDSKERAQHLVAWDEEFGLTDDETRDLLTHFWSITEAWSGDDHLREGMYRMLERVAPIEVYDERPLPQTKWLTVYRGNLGETPGPYMMSWSLDRGVAELFARMAMSPRGMFLGMHRVGGVPSIWRAQVLRESVLAYFDDRDEQEVVVFGAALRDVELIAQAVKPEDG